MSLEARIPSFMDELSKIAQEQQEAIPEQQEGDPLVRKAKGVAMTAGGAGLALNSGTRGRLLGYQRVYHGTGGDAAPKIRAEGFRANLGGSGATTHAVGKNLEAAGDFGTSTRGKVHVSPQKWVAGLYAKYMKNRGGKGGEVVTADLPMELWDKFERDPYSAPPGTGKMIAARGATDIAPELVHGGKGYSKLRLLGDRLRGLPSYVAKHPGRFGLGLATLGGGAYLAHRGVQNVTGGQNG